MNTIKLDDEELSMVKLALQKADCREHEIGIDLGISPFEGYAKLLAKVEAQNHPKL